MRSVSWGCQSTPTPQNSPEVMPASTRSSDFQPPRSDSRSVEIGETPTVASTSSVVTSLSRSLKSSTTREAEKLQL